MYFVAEEGVRGGEEANGDLPRVGESATLNCRERKSSTSSGYKLH